MISFRSPIIPHRVKVMQLQQPETLDLPAICVFAATGFFLEADTYYSNRKALQPAIDYQLKSNGEIIEGKPYWNWHYAPRNIGLKEAVDEFGFLLEKFVADQIKEESIILPLSGGLDSRTLAVALYRNKKKVSAYSYSFFNGHNESKYGQEISTICGFPFNSWIVEPGYLWNGIEKLAEINRCCAEFTHPRQMAFIDHYASLGDSFALGHWGDVLFDDMGVPDDLPFEQQVEIVLKKILKKGGLELATTLWQAWGLQGDFRDYLRDRVKKLLAGIDIPDSANARIRAFKSLYWAPRWTTSNLSIFEFIRPIHLPYYTDEMCQFISSIPEQLLSGRKIQIEYIKTRFPKLARVAWQQNYPFNLYNYKANRPPLSWITRGINKLEQLTNKNDLVQRNWELQFTGQNNSSKLEGYLINSAFNDWIPVEACNHFLNKFHHHNSVHYSHPVSILLTLALFNKKKRELRFTDFEKSN